MRRELLVFKAFQSLPGRPSPSAFHFSNHILSSLDLALCYTEGQPYPARDPSSPVLSLYLDHTFPFSGSEKLCKSEILSQPGDPGIPESSCLSILPSMMSRRESYSQDNEKKEKEKERRRKRKGKRKRKVAKGEGEKESLLHCLREI